jgi:hypothetical protein
MVLFSLFSGFQLWEQMQNKKFESRERPYVFEQLCIIYRLGLINAQQLNQLCERAGTTMNTSYGIPTHIYPQVFDMNELKPIERILGNILLYIRYAVHVHVQLFVY